MVSGASSEGVDEFEEDMAAFGLMDELSHMPKRNSIIDEMCEVWDDNLEAFSLFMQLDTKWYVCISPDGEFIRTGLMGHEIQLAIRYASNEIRKNAAALFNQIQMMEKAALFEMNQARNKRIENANRKN